MTLLQHEHSYREVISFLIASNRIVLKEQGALSNTFSDDFLDKRLEFDKDRCYSTNELRRVLFADESIRAYLNRHQVRFTSDQERSIEIPFCTRVIANKADLGREELIDKMTIILNKSHKKNILLVGQAGVGKTSLVSNLADRYPIYQLNTANLLSGTGLRGSLEDKLMTVIHEVKRQQVILFIDEIHILASLEGVEGGINIMDQLKPDLAAGEMKMIGATTICEAKKLRYDEAFIRRFYELVVPPLTKNEVMAQVSTLIDKEVARYPDPPQVNGLSKKVMMSALLSLEDRPRFIDDAVDLIDTALAILKYHAIDGLSQLSDSQFADKLASFTGERGGDDEAV